MNFTELLHKASQGLKDEYSVSKANEFQAEALPSVLTEVLSDNSTENSGGSSLTDNDEALARQAALIIQKLRAKAQRAANELDSAYSDRLEGTAAQLEQEFKEINL